MASCAEGLSLSELLGDELFEEFIMSKSSTSASSAEFKRDSSEDLERLIANTENKGTKRTTQT